MINLNIINWCNNNQGFLEAITLFLTLPISIGAVYSSIKLAYLPYKKSIILDYFITVENSQYNFNIAIVNSGNKLIGISSISIKYKKTDIGSTCTKKFIEPSKIENFFVETELANRDIKYDKNPEVAILIIDTEGKNYFFKVPVVFG